MELKDIKKGKELKPPKVMLYGVHGIGKSTWAASAKAPIFIQTEDGLGNISCDKFPLAKTANDIYDALTLLKREKHDYKTVVIDSLDWAEKIIYNDIVTANRAKSIDDFNVKALAYAGGRKMSLTVWNNILSLLTALNQERGMTIILLAHAMIKRFDSPLTAPYDRYQLDLYEKAAALLNQWVDVIAFCNYKVIAKSEDIGFGANVTRGEGSGRRVIYLEERPAFDAKNHFALPFEIPLTNWTDLAKLIAASIKGGTKTNGTDTGKTKPKSKPSGAGVDKQDRQADSSGSASGNSGQGDVGAGGGPSEALPNDGEKGGGGKKGASKAAKQPSQGDEQQV